MAIPLLDLTAQYAAIRDEIDQALRAVIESQRFVLGPVVERFERAMAERLGVRYAIGCASGTDALLLALRALETRPGDEVIVPTFTFFATAGAVWNAGLRPVFCDVDARTFNVTAQTVDAVWSPRTRAVIPVHLFGQMAPVETIRILAGERRAFVLEDAAQAIGARRRIGESRVAAGAAGDAGGFSFFPSKNLGCFGDGGLVTTDDVGLAEGIRKLRVHGGEKLYDHEIVGTNSRLDALQAAVLLAKLPHLDAWTQSRRRNAGLYDELLEGVEGVVAPAAEERNEHVFNQYTIRAARRDELVEHLGALGIGTAVYYPLPLHLQSCFRELGHREGDFPTAERLSREVLSLPVYPELGAERIERVGSAVRAFYEGRG
ncbi:MAG: DegT/DnrJ/EryC1/StrS family aminotransferase [Gemmatimonadetes bacterium]|nr:DegT/DnrJ/EryC1/StrS family aminotransferase [Gemmatimonadota bacterium]